MKTSLRRFASRPTLRAVLLAALCGMPVTTTLRGEEGPRPPTGRVRLGSGRLADFMLHFDRNALRDSLRVGDGLIALTASGALLRFDLPTVRLTRERGGTEEVTCLGRGEGGAVLAGLSDGRVCRLDPVTLDLTDVARLPSEPRWIGRIGAEGGRKAGLVVATRPTKPVVRYGRRWEVPSSTVHDLATGKTFALEEESTVFLLDRAGRLWLGADKGEWGGRVTRVDLLKGTFATLEPPPACEPDRDAYWRGVYGFIELHDGQVWAFGGTSHMGLNAGEVTRIDVDRPRRMLAFENLGEEPDPNLPVMPITHVIEEDGGLFVVSYSDVFRVDKALKSWKKAATLEIQYRWGRPDAVGSYPSVRAIHPPTRDGEPYVLATAVDGYVLLEGTKAIPRGLPGQLGASRVSAIENTSEGTFFFEGDDRLPPWTLREQGWEVASLDPPFEVDPANDAAEFEKTKGTWYETRVLVGPGGAIFTVSGTGMSDGTRTTARRVGGKSVRLGRETSSLDPASSFITADGTLWNASSGELKRFEAGRWEVVARLPGEEGPGRLDPIKGDGPPWLLLDRIYDNLWRLDPGAPGDDPRLTRLESREGEKPLRINDAIAWHEGALLLATDAGLRAYDLAAERPSKVDLEGPMKPVNALARDGLGRLWLGSDDGLWMVEAGGNALESFDRVPWVRRDEVVALALDPEHDDGVIVSLGSRGVAFVRASREP